jgi:protein farnesyltransferase/geranylgeranyltransferase type-1 subunit alpha
LILKHLNDYKLWETELKFLDEFIEDNRKNYQVWRHRQLVVEQLGLNEGSQELKFSRHILSFDEKNYHAWTYR